MQQIRSLSCPNCGAPLEVKDIQRIKTVICHSCGSQIDLSDPNLGIVGQFFQGQAPPRTPIAPGMWGDFELLRDRFQVIGRIRYRDQESWDEWLMSTQQGRFRWLSEGKEGFAIWEPIVPTNPIDVNQLGGYDEVVGGSLNLEGTPARITDRGTGSVEFIEGEMTWKARGGDRMNYLEAEGGDVRYSIEWTADEVEFFRGQRLDNNTVRRAFGLPEVAVAAPRRRLSPALIVILVVVGVILLCICISLVSSGSTTASSGSSGGSSGPVFIPGPIFGGGSSGGSGGGSIRGGSPGGSRGGGSSGGSSGGGGGK
jgi:hypothetical protein